MNSLRQLVLALFLTSVMFGQSESEKIQKMVDLFVSAYNSKNYSLIEEQFNRDAKAKVASEELKKWYDALHQVSGKIKSVGKAAFIDKDVAVYQIEFERGAMELLIALDEQGKIRGLDIHGRKVNASRNKTDLILPFKGTWIVEWGGDTPEQNYHQSISIVRFAFDFLKVDEDGNTHKGDGKKSEDYFGFGQGIVAPADGVVTDVINGVRDNVPGLVNNFVDVGNMVMIRHANGEVSLFAHLKFQSTLVRVGQKVKQGQTIGLCGNSGNSDEPHLHYQLQEADFPKPDSTMKVFFKEIKIKQSDRTEVRKDYSPIKGEIVSQ
jgi:murein DD-endopeptidase MepM/ murein hydrolase activator NlpD